MMTVDGGQVRASALASSGAGFLAGCLSSLGGAYFPALVWFSPAVLFTALCTPLARRWVPLAVAYGLAEGIEPFGIGQYGSAAVMISVGSNVVERLVTLGALIQLARHLPRAAQWIFPVALPLLDVAAARLMGRFYLPVSFIDHLGDSASAMGWVAIIGPVGVSAMVCLFGALLSTGCRRAMTMNTRSATVWISVAFVAAAFCFVFGARYQRRALDVTRTIRVAAIQGAVPNWIYPAARWVPAIETAVENRYLDELAALTPGQVDLVVMPETAIRPAPGHLPEIEAALSAHADRLGATIVAGLPVRVDSDDERNAGLIFAPGEGRIARIDKRTLVPLMERSLTAGSVGTTTTTPVGRLGVMICVESIYRDRSLELDDENAEILLVLSNDAGFGTSFIAQTHAQRAAIRAAETGLPVVHAAQYASTRIYDARGILLGRQNQRGTLVVNVPLVNAE